MIINFLFLIGLVYLGYKTAYKYHLPSHYEYWRATITNSILDKILPKTFCDQCFITQLSLMVSAILVIAQQTSLFSMFMYGLGTAGIVLWMAINETRY
jgi:hypothetical protein